MLYLSFMSTGNFGGFDAKGNILCNKCAEFTNKHYVAVPDLQCWNCGEQIFGDHIDIIYDIMNFFIKGEKLKRISPPDIDKKYEHIKSNR